jgi:ABC-2 type transport system permease protein
MTTMIQTQPVTILQVREPKARFFDLCASEWIKLRSLRSTYWVLAFAVLATIFINLNGVRSSLQYIDPPANPRPMMPGEKPWVYDPLWRSLSSISGQLLMLAGASFGALAVFGEYSTGLIRTTFAAVPARRGVVSAKIAMVALITTLLGFLVALVSFVGGQAIVKSHHVGMALHDPGAFRAIAGYALVMPVAALVGMMFGAVIRHATGTIVAVVAALFFLPAMFGGDRYRWVKEVSKLFPSSAEGRLTFWSHSNGNMGKWPPSLTHAWLVYLGWTVLSIVVTILVVKKRDV